MHFLRWFLWISPNVLLTLCLTGLLRQRRQRPLLLFVGYITFQLVEFLTSITFSFLASKSLVSPNSYLWVVTLGAALGVMLELCVLYELANELMLSRSSSASTLRALLRWTAAIVLLVAASVSALFSQPGLQRVMKIFQTLDFSSNLLIIGLLLSLLLFSRVLQISWRSLPSGIALGFGVYASAEIAASSLLSVLGRPGFVKVDLVRMAAFHMCVLVWFVYIFFTPKARVARGVGLKQLELETWDQELERMVHRWSHL